MTEWFVLRTAPSSTLRLASSLTEAGFEVWTPTAIQTRRVGRSRKRAEHKVSILPTFVFARLAHLGDLLRLAKMATTSAPGFSVFHYYDKIPLIADGSLEPLRAEEKRVARRAKPGEFKPGHAVPFEVGETVRMSQGIGAGMTGVVETSTGKFTLVCFPGYRSSLKIATFLLDPVEAEKEPISEIPAARAA